MFRLELNVKNNYQVNGEEDKMSDTKMLTLIVNYNERTSGFGENNYWIFPLVNVVTFFRIFLSFPW